MHQFAPLHTVITVCVKNNISADVAYHRFLSLNPWSPKRTTLSQVFLVGFAVGILRADSPTVPPPPLPPLSLADPQLGALLAFKVCLAAAVRPSKRIPYTT